MTWREAICAGVGVGWGVGLGLVGCWGWGWGWAVDQRILNKMWRVEMKLLMLLC